MSENNSSRTDFLIAALIALSMLSLLAPFPRPRAVSETPWLVELATTLVFAGVLGFFAVRDRDLVNRMFTIGEPLTKWIVRFFAVFALWSLVSAAWARSPYLPVHHALLWSEYILFFLFFRERLSTGGGMRLVSGIFILLAAIIGILAVIEYVTLPDFTALELVIRARYSAYSELLVTILPIIWTIALYSPKRSSYLLVQAAGALGWTAVMLSMSKGVFLAGIIGFLVLFAGMLLFHSGRLRRRAFGTLGLWLMITVAVQAGFSLLTPIPSTVDYISGKADPTRNSSIARVLIWKVGATMAREHPAFGVGADNFGVAFNDARANYRKDHPADPPDEPASDNLIERGHGELLQIAAELGVVGVLLFAFPFGLFGFALLKAFSSRRKRIPPVLLAAVAGMIAFGVSSMFSSFSFRIAQNGVAFFIVFAIATNELAKLDRRAGISEQRTKRGGLVHLVLPLFFAASLIILGTKAYAEYCVLAADREADKAKALAIYERAHLFDPGYASAYLHRSGRSYADQDFFTAAVDIRKAIDGGCGVVLTYSALATAQAKMGDGLAEEKTFNEALAIFPRSVFLRVRHAVRLSEKGRTADSQIELAKALEIDKRQANGWHDLLTIGSVRTFYAAQADPAVAAPADLLPEAAVLEYLDKGIGE